MGRATRMLAVLALALLLLPACGDDEESFPTGRWTASDPDRGVLVLEFREDGTWALSGADPGQTVDDVEEVDTGTYSSDSETFTWETDEVCDSTASEAAPGTYAWELEDDQLTLTLEEDPCNARVDVADGLVLTQLEG